MGGSSLFLFSKVVQTPHRKGPSLNLTQELSCCEVTVLNSIVQISYHSKEPSDLCLFSVTSVYKMLFFLQFQNSPMMFQRWPSVCLCGNLFSWQFQRPTRTLSLLSLKETKYTQTWHVPFQDSPKQQLSLIWPTHNDTLDTWDRLQQRT